MEEIRFPLTSIGFPFYNFLGSKSISCLLLIYTFIIVLAAGLQWLQGFRLQGSVWEQDATLLSTMYMWFLSSVAAPRAWLNTTMRLDTSEVRGHRLDVATRLTWPSLVPGVPHKHISFPLTQVSVADVRNTAVESLKDKNGLYLILAKGQFPILFTQMTTLYLNGLYIKFDAQGLSYFSIIIWNMIYVKIN